MRKFIYRLQNKPERTRRKILLLTSFGVTIVIGLFWLASFSRLDDRQATATSTEKSPLTALKENLSNAYSSLPESSSTIETYTTDEPTGQVSTSSESFAE